MASLALLPSELPGIAPQRTAAATLSTGLAPRAPCPRWALAGRTTSAGAGEAGSRSARQREVRRAPGALLIQAKRQPDADPPSAPCVLVAIAPQRCSARSNGVCGAGSWPLLEPRSRSRRPSARLLIARPSSDQLEAGVADQALESRERDASRRRCAPPGRLNTRENPKAARPLNRSGASDQQRSPGTWPDHIPPPETIETALFTDAAPPPSRASLPRLGGVAVPSGLTSRMAVG